MRTSSVLVSGLAIVLASSASAAPVVDVQSVIGRYCDRLLAGAPAATRKDEARKDGFKDVTVAGQAILQKGTLFVSLSDAPRACLVQAPAAMTFEQGTALVDAWASHYPGAVRSPATRGPDGSPVRAWSSASQKVSMLVAQQSNALNQKVLAFVRMRTPTAAR